MENPEIKVLIEEISNLRREIIEMKIEIEGLKSDIEVISELNKKTSEEYLETKGSKKNSIKLIETPKKDLKKQVNEIREVKVNLEQNNEDEFVKIDRDAKKRVRDILKSVIRSDLRYDTWLKVGVNNLTKNQAGEYVFPAANDFTRGILEVRYREMIETTLKEIFPDLQSLKFIALDEAHLA